MIGADRLPGVSVPRHANGQDIGTDVEIDARIKEVGRRNAEFIEMRQPSAVDLHQSQIVAAIDILVNRSRIEVGFLLGNGIENLRIDAITARHRLPCARVGRR